VVLGTRYTVILTLTQWRIQPQGRLSGWPPSPYFTDLAAARALPDPLFHTGGSPLTSLLTLNCLHGLLPGPFLLNYSDFVFSFFPYFFSFCAVR